MNWAFVWDKFLEGLDISNFWTEDSGVLHGIQLVFLAFMTFVVWLFWPRKKLVPTANERPKPRSPEEDDQVQAVRNCQNTGLIRRLFYSARCWLSVRL